MVMHKVYLSCGEVSDVVYALGIVAGMYGDADDTKPLSGGTWDHLRDEIENQADTLHHALNREARFN